MKQIPPERPALTRKERDLARNRKEIIETAVALFAEFGYYQTTMQMIAERAEFSVGYLYKHFSGKEEMFSEMVRFHMERLDEIIAEVDAEGMPPLEGLHRTYVRVAEHFNAHPDFMRIYHQEIGGESGEPLERKKDHYDDLVVTLDAAVAAGELRADLDVGMLAAAMTGAVRELFRVMSERGGDRPFTGLADIVFHYLIDPHRP
jgi:AcrR family transcriptional regulator